MKNVWPFLFLLTLPSCSAAANCLKAVQWVALCTVAARWVYVPIWRGQNCFWFSFGWLEDETEASSRTLLLSLSVMLTGSLSERLCSNATMMSHKAIPVTAMIKTCLKSSAFCTYTAWNTWMKASLHLQSDCCCQVEAGNNKRRPELSVLNTMQMNKSTSSSKLAVRILWLMILLCSWLAYNNKGLQWYLANCGDFSVTNEGSSYTAAGRAHAQFHSGSMEDGKWNWVSSVCVKWKVSEKIPLVAIYILSYCWVLRIYSLLFLVFYLESQSGRTCQIMVFS